MTDANKTVYTTCPFSGKANSWEEFEFESGKWKGQSSADGSTITAETYEALRLRYEKITLARLLREEEEKN